MKVNPLFFVSLFILASCKNNVESKSLSKAIIEITKKEFQKRSVELDYLTIDSLIIETINFRDFYIDRINNFATYVANATTANQSRIKDLINKGDTAMANKIQANQIEILKTASVLDSLHNIADASIKVLKAIYLLDAKFHGGRLNEKVTNYLYKKDTTVVTIQVRDPFLQGIINGNDYLMLISMTQTPKENF